MTGPPSYSDPDDRFGRTCRCGNALYLEIGIIENRNGIPHLNKQKHPCFPGSIEIVECAAKCGYFAPRYRRYDT